METKLRCHLIEGTPTESDLSPSDAHFDVIKTFEEDSHLSRRILKCKRCGQLYFYEFYEEIDWKEGNDSQYCTYIPIETVEEAEELNKKSQFALLGVVPRLQDDFLQDGTKTIEWMR